LSSRQCRPDNFASAMRSGKIVPRLQWMQATVLGWMVKARRKVRRNEGPETAFALLSCGCAILCWSCQHFSIFALAPRPNCCLRATVVERLKGPAGSLPGRPHVDHDPKQHHV
jgi:hypothetical protein